MSRPLSDGDYRALARFRRALRIFLRFSEEAARAAGVTPAQHQLLLAVRGHDGDGPPSVGDVAEALQLKLHSAVELVSRAEAAGLVETAADPADARRRLVAVTAGGEARLTDLTALHRAELSRFRHDLEAVLKQLD